MAWGKSCDFSEPQSPHQCNGDNDACTVHEWRVICGYGAQAGPGISHLLSFNPCDKAMRSILFPAFPHKLGDIESPIFGRGEPDSTYRSTVLHGVHYTEFRSLFSVVTKEDVNMMETKELPGTPMLLQLFQGFYRTPPGQIGLHPVSSKLSASSFDTTGQHLFVHPLQSGFRASLVPLTGTRPPVPLRLCWLMAPFIHGRLVPPQPEN